MGRWPSAASDGRANVRQDRKYCLVWRPEIGWCWMVPGSDATWPVRSFVIRASDKRSAFCAEASPAGKRCADGGGAGTGVAVMIAGASLKTDRQAAHQLSPVMGSPAWRDCHEQGLFGLARIAFGSHSDHMGIWPLPSMTGVSCPACRVLNFTRRTASPTGRNCPRRESCNLACAADATAATGRIGHPAGV